MTRCPRQALAAGRPPFFACLSLACQRATQAAPGRCGPGPRAQTKAPASRRAGGAQAHKLAARRSPSVRPAGAYAKGGYGIDVRIVGGENNQPIVAELAAKGGGLARIVLEDELGLGQLKEACKLLNAVLEGREPVPAEHVADADLRRRLDHDPAAFYRRGAGAGLRLAGLALAGNAAAVGAVHGKGLALVDDAVDAPLAGRRACGGLVLQAAVGIVDEAALLIGLAVEVIDIAAALEMGDQLALGRLGDPDALERELALLGELAAVWWLAARLSLALETHAAVEDEGRAVHEAAPALG